MWHLDKIPKIVHFYWGRSTLPYLRYVTITSFIQYNPDWRIVLWTIKDGLATNNPSGHRYVSKCKDFLPQLFKLPIEIREVDFSQFGMSNSMSDVHKSNVVNYYALSTEGGCWSDMDILYFRPITDLLINKSINREIETVVCIGEYGHSGGFYLSSSNNKYFTRLLSLCKQEYRANAYQCLGPDLCNKYFKNIDIIKQLASVVNMGVEAIYAHDALHIPSIINGSPSLFTSGSIGLHWYGGHVQWDNYFKITDGGLVTTANNVLNKILNKLRHPISENKDAKISIVMAYLNRQRLLDATIKSIRATRDTNYEIIIVDDGSDTKVKCDEAKIIRIEKTDKWWTNPCVPFNIGFNNASGDIIIIQNPECYHIGDIISYVRTHIKTNTYLSFGCYAMNQGETDLFHRGVMPNLNNQIFSGTTRNGWYNHSLYRPKAYHFCSAILRQDLDMIGGFDERYASGISYDDDDFIRSIKMLGMDVRIIDAPHVIHQFHTLMAYDHPQMRMLHERNKKLYEDKYKPPPPTTKSSPRRKISALSRRQRDRQRKEREALLKKKRDEQQPL